jgi:hypothetical protein
MMLNLKEFPELIWKWGILTLGRDLDPHRNIFGNAGSFWVKI